LKTKTFVGTTPNAVKEAGLDGTERDADAALHAV
jgi:hypothetical protein